jgi:hypothetical protein
MTGLLLLASGNFVQCFFESVYYNGPFPQSTFPLLYLTVFLLPAVISLVHFSGAHSYRDEGSIVYDAISPLNAFFGISATIILAFFHITTPTVEVFFQSSGTVISFLVLFVLGINLHNGTR